MDEIPRRELDFEALGGRVIEHVASAEGAYYRLFGGDPVFTGDDVTKYFVTQDGASCMLERCIKPVQSAELEQMQARKEQRRLEREAAAQAAARAVEGAHAMMDAHIQFAPIASLERLNDPAWNRADRTLYDSGSLSFMPGRTEIPLLIDHDEARQVGVVQHAVPHRGDGRPVAECRLSRHRSAGAG